MKDLQYFKSRMENSEILSLAENEDFRSSYVRSLVQMDDTDPLCISSRERKIPNIIMQYWHDSTNIPPDVQECISSWEPLESVKKRRVFFDDKLARKFISTHYPKQNLEAFNRCYHPAMRCDYFRICYIYKFGGFYVDADECYLGAQCPELFRDDRLKIQPLCYDKASGKMVPNAIFLKEPNPSSEWIFYFNNNPLIAPPNHPLIKLALDRSTYILMSSTHKPDIQSTTGPGNLTACIVYHAMMLKKSNKALDFKILKKWDSVAISRWPLCYRNDARNWRLGKELWN